MNIGHHLKLSRRRLIAALATILVPITMACGGVPALAQSDPLPSWNDTSAKRAIVEFVTDTTKEGSRTFVPPEERIATFDQDGTLWVEHPMYSQLIYCLDRVPAVVAEKPELRNIEPFKTILAGDREAIARLPKTDLEKLLAVTLTGMTVEQLQAEVKKWIASAKDPRWVRPYTALTYQPMKEVLVYLRANGFKTYIVTGGGQDFVRVYSEATYGIPPEQVVGSAGSTTYSYDKDGRPILVTLRSPKIEAGNLTFDVSVLEGSLSGGSGPAALFIDPGLFNYWHAPVYHGSWYARPAIDDPGLHYNPNSIECSSPQAQSAGYC